MNLPDQAPVPNSTLRVLLVDDADLIARIVEMLVGRAKGEFLHASDGEVGLAKAIAEQPAIILMDLQMPVMDGFETVRRIRDWEKASPGHKRTLIYAFTAKCQPGEEAIFLASGFDGYLPKSVPINDFLQLLRDIKTRKLHQAGDFSKIEKLTKE